jgi:DNA-binding MarR family transcriptional regulator
MNELTQSLSEELLAIMLDMKHELFALADEHGLTIVQLFTLLSIKRNGCIPMGRVAGILHCDASNVTGIVERLVTRKLIVRTESERDRREKVLQLTPEGETVIENYLALLPSRLGGGSLTDNELATLTSVFKKMNARRSEVKCA